MRTAARNLKEETQHNISEAFSIGLDAYVDLAFASQIYILREYCSMLSYNLNIDNTMSLQWTKGEVAKIKYCTSRNSNNYYNILDTHELDMGSYI